MRLLSYNIHKGIGGRDRQYRLDRVIDVIETENPDFICLQEVDRHVRRSRFDDQPRMLAEYFKAAGWAYQPNVHLTTGAYGNLVLSRWRLRTKHQISLRLRDKKSRGAQMIVADTPEGPVHLVNMHLGLSEQERHWQIGHLLGHHLFRESAHLPTVLCGDYNDWRNTLHRAALGHFGFRHATTPISRFRSFPAYLPLGSLDKLFVRGAVFVRHLRVVHSRTARRASDHLPLVADFHLDNAAMPP